MTEQQALWQMVLDQPLSRMARRVYADWLEDRGDPRGEFIQVQCAADRLWSDDPRKAVLEARADELLWQHEADWLGPMRGHVRSWRFRRGLLEWVSVDAAAFLAHADAWSRDTGLLGVHLRHASDHLDALAACPAVGRLAGLYLGDNELTSDDLRVLLRSPHLRQLRRLYLQCNRLDQEAAGVLAACPSLTRLHDLNLGRNFIGDEGVQALVRSPHLRRLRRLNLMMAGLNLAGIESLAEWPGLAGVRSLLLGSNQVGPGGLARLARSPYWQRLRLLAFGMNDVTDQDMQTLADAPRAASLRSLDLSMNRRLGDAGVQALAASPHAGNLRELYLGYSTFGNAGLAALARPRGLRRLRRLSLAGGFVGDTTGVACLLRGPLLRRLRSLDLSCVPLDAAGLAALRRPTPRLHYLRLDLPAVEVSAWRRLVVSGALRSLTHLVAGSLPAGGLAALCAAGAVPRLTTLRLPGWKGSADEVRLLDQCGLLGQLRRLSLASPGEQTMAGSIAVLARSPRVAGLTLLDLSHAPLGDAGVQALTAGRHWGRLTRLDLSGCRLGQAAAEALARWRGLVGLRQLHLRSNRIAPAGAAALAASPHLSDLLCVDLDGADLTADARADLRRRLGGRVAFGWRTTPESIVFGAYQHDDT